MKIDIFPHIIPPKFKEALYKKVPSGFFGKAWIEAMPTLTDIEARLRILDKFGDVVQVLTLGNPPVEKVVNTRDAIELSQIANDEMAELVLKYPDRFVAAVACVPMNDVDAALKEIDRAIVDLRFRGIQLHNPIGDKPMDAPEFFPIYEKMSEYNLPIWVHSQRNMNVPDYKGEDKSKYIVWSLFCWPYETSVYMTRLIFGGVFNKYPNLKVITHHAGGMVPYFASRIAGFYDANEMLLDLKWDLTGPPLDYFRLFYADTAIYKSTSSLMCCYDFFGAGHILFGTDMPYDSQFGLRQTREVIESIEAMTISAEEKKMIFEDNARRLLRLPI
jgi:predicted TIM-barrel fold metal-dependent hydrolase